MLPTNYTELQTTIIELMEDDSVEFAEYVPTAIFLAEARMYRLVDHDFTVEDSSQSLAFGDSVLNKPADHRVANNVYISVGNELRRLVMKSESFLRDYWPGTNQVGEPKYYANRNDAQWLVAPTSNSNYPIVIDYEAQPTPLSDTVPTNIFLEKYPDLLLYACLSNMAEWARDMSLAEQWQSKLTEALSSTNIEGARERRDDNAHGFNPEGGLNTKG